jgi:DNA-binding CsgD family transcriptional regulator
MRDQIRSTLDGICEAAIRPELWPAAMAEVSTLFGCIGAILEPEDLHGYTSLPATRSLENFVAAYLRDGWYKEDIRRERRHKQRRESIILDQDLVTPQEAECLPFYQELLKPHGLGYGASLRFGSHDRGWSLSLQRATAQGPFGADEIALMKDVVPHLQQSGATALTLAMRHDQGIMSGLGSMRSAAALIDRRGEVLSYTPEFARFIGDGLVLRNRRLATELSRQDRKLQALVECGLRAVHEAGDCAPARLQIMRGGARRPLIAAIMPLRRSAMDVFSAAGALLTVVDPGEPLAVPEDILATDYALTPAEIRLAVRLADGTRLSVVAEALGMSYQTARTHLKQIFSKLDVHKQSEMVAQIRSLAGRPC